VYSNTQLPYWVRTNVAFVLGLPEEDVTIITTGIGGAFGSKLYPQIEPFVALLARATGRPVRMVVPLSDELKAGLPRHPARTRLKTGVTRDGTLVARQATIIMDAGAYTGSTVEIASVSVLVLAGPYRTDHVSIDALGVLTNKTNFGAYRGPGGPQPMFALESHLDHVAEVIGIDPLELRLKNIVGEGDETANGQVMHNVGLREAVLKTAEAIEWGKPSGPNRGKGLALGWWTTTLQLSTTRVELAKTGRIVVNVGTQEIGTGAIMGGVPQVVAETFGVGMDQVEVVVNPTSEGLWDWGSQGSRTLFNVGRSAHFASQELIEKIKSLAEKVLEVPAADLLISQGFVINRGNPEERISLEKLAQLDINGDLTSRNESRPEFAPYDESRLKSCMYPAFHHPNFHCHAAEVEVDPGTGEVTVLRYAAAHDVGKAINPTLVEGQIQGGAVQGIGMALMEEIVYDGSGYMINPNWTDYKLPTLADTPDINAIIVEAPSEVGPFGSKGLGESPVLYGPAVLGNAISRAIGVRMTSLPMTAERILKAIRRAEA
jgi:CO/xanthine dehydrogenase Mo-binding subunit